MYTGIVLGSLGVRQWTGVECETGVELDVWYGWISALLNPDSKKREEVWIPNFEGIFLITRNNCCRQCVHVDFEIVAPCRIPGLVMLVSGREGSSPWDCPESHEFVY